MATAPSSLRLPAPAPRPAPTEYVIYLIDPADLPPPCESFDTAAEAHELLAEWHRLNLADNTGLLPMLCVAKGGAS